MEGMHHQQHGGGGYGYNGPAGGGGHFRGGPVNAKTKLCQRWATGDCRFGDRCNFAHGEHELRALPPRTQQGGGGGYPRGGGPAYADDGHHHHQHPHHHHHPPHHQAGPPGGVEDVYARQGYPVQGPNGWVLYRAQDTGDVYYHNHNTGATQWERPAEWPSAP